MVSGHGEHRRAEAEQELRRALVLVAAAAVREVARGDDECGCGILDQGPQSGLHLRPIVGADVEVRDVDDACRHSRRRL